MGDRPTFGLVVPAYNRVDRIEGAMLSAVDQDFAEIVVVDDGSTDGTGDVVLSLARSHPSVKLVRQENSGAARARNRGVEECQAEWISFLDSDDSLDADWLETYRGAIDHGVDIVTAGHREVSDGTGLPLRTVLPTDLAPLFPSILGNFTHGGSYAMRRSVFEAVGGFAPTLRAGQHTELSFRILKEAPMHGWSVAAINRPVMTYRVGVPGNIRGDQAARTSAARFMLETHGDLLRRDPRRLADSASVLAAGLGRAGDKRGSRSYLRLALRHDPWSVKRWIRAVLAHTVGIRYWRRS